MFQADDLTVFFTGPSGATDPYSVTYTMYWTPKNSECPKAVGAIDRIPVRTGIGEYYATGIAGQCGQPGDGWKVVWRFRDTANSPLQEVTQGFVVFDTGKYCPGSCTPARTSCGCSNTCGSCTPTYGW